MKSIHWKNVILNVGIGMFWAFILAWMFSIRPPWQYWVVYILGDLVLVWWSGRRFPMKKSSETKGQGHAPQTH
jgi:hypothetical protein